MTSLKVSNMIDLTGRVALVTGGGTGIGLMAARGLADNGAKVYITGRRESVLKEAAEKYGLHPLRMDVMDKNSIREAVKTLKDKEGKLDVLFNNAGNSGPAYPRLATLELPGEGQQSFGEEIFEQTDFSEWGNHFAMNVTTVFAVTNAFLDLLIAGARARGEGEYASVINDASCAARLNSALGGMAAYAITKNGTEHMTRYLALTYAQRRIPVRVNSISPGTFPSELTTTDPVQIEAMTKNPLPGYINTNPTFRPGREEEVASLIVYLSSRAGDYTNGTNMLIDGGLCLMNL